MVKKVCDFYNQHPNYSNKYIASIFKIRDTTVSNYLYKGNKLGFCNYKPHNKIPVKITIGKSAYIFKTLNECIRNISFIYKKEINLTKLRKSLHNRETSFDDLIINYI